MEPPCGGAGGKSERPRLEADLARSAARARRRRPGSSRCRCPGPMSLAAASTSAVPSAQQARPGARRRAERGIGRRGHAPADQQPAVAHRARARIAPRPAEALGAELVACVSERLEKGRFSPSSIAGSLRRRSSIGSMPSSYGELVHRALEREDAARLARPAHEGRRADVERRQPVARAHVRAGVEIAATRRAAPRRTARSGEVSPVPSWIRLVSRPSGVAPSATRCVVRGRWPVVKNICLRRQDELDRAADLRAPPGPRA